MSQSSTVVSFPVIAGSAKASQKGKGSAGPEAKTRRKNAVPGAPSGQDRLIADCVEYARMIAAFNAGFSVDPTGNNDFAGSKNYHRTLGRACDLLASIARRPATTVMALQAKARVVHWIMEDGASHSPEERDIDFLISFASDVEKFLTPLVNDDEMTSKS
jgi:hypothetical protein